MLEGKRPYDNGKHNDNGVSNSSFYHSGQEKQ